MDRVPFGARLEACDLLADPESLDRVPGWL